MAIFELKTKHRRRQRFNDRRGHNQETLVLPRRRSGWGLLLLVLRSALGPSLLHGKAYYFNSRHGSQANAWEGSFLAKSSAILPKVVSAVMNARIV